MDDLIVITDGHWDIDPLPENTMISIRGRISKFPPAIRGKAHGRATRMFDPPPEQKKKGQEGRNKMDGWLILANKAP